MCPAEIETMAYHGEAPWHGLGVQVPDVMTWAEAIKAAELDWQVEMRPLYYPVNGVHEEVKIRRAVVRTSDQKVLGVVGTDYVPVQNTEAFRFLDDIVDDSRPKYETVGSLRGGQRVWALARMPKELKINGIDEVVPYLLLVNGHDGTHSLMVAVTPIRVVCMNTLNMALRSTPRYWKAKHAGDVEGRIQAAKETLGLAYRYVESFEQIANGLCAVTLTDGELLSFTEKVLPPDPKSGEVTPTTEQRRQQLLAIAKTAPDLEPFRGTAWAAYNAAVALNDHAFRTDHADRNLERAWFMPTIKDRAFDLLYERANVKETQAA